MGFGNEPTGCVRVGVPAYAFGLWAIHRYVGGWEWYWWIAAVIGPIFSVFILMLIVMIKDRGKKGEIVLCPKCGKFRFYGKRTRRECRNCGFVWIKGKTKNI